ncbi:hypothetical protein LRS12_17065 [Sphingomonas sp. J344]|uniref:hypothetical protein n=1 Tax=Sphingomonas sp. J344 TaxID=2898434 RepID=UPI002150E082|nr:hypothetical protein [Sphingomonas sp. J344]MCR5872266.1 hypothetical protein [Sphingomonas sp. J344]
MFIAALADVVLLDLPALGGVGSPPPAGHRKAMDIGGDAYDADGAVALGGEVTPS